MGKNLSKLRGQLITRPMQRFNIESRTEKLLNRDKPIPAPKYPTDIELLDKVRRENPEILEETRKRDPELENRLKQVFVQSIDPPDFNPDLIRKAPDNPNRPLPQRFNRGKKWKGFYTDPQRTIARGRISLENAQELLSLFKKDSATNTIQKLAEQYRIDMKNTENLVEYCRVFFMYHVKAEEGQRKTNDPYLPQPDWVDDSDDQPKKVLPVQPAALKPLTREMLRLGESPAKTTPT